MACAMGHDKVVEILLQHRADLNIRNSVRQQPQKLRNIIRFKFNFVPNIHFTEWRHRSDAAVQSPK
jgi:hypothetical protein